ncbi:PhzF family phenazine biosynthesis protein [Sediminicurvatus halobius]|nr:PhzF family phenazine biosynthesis protein [Spiribacter halobius]UEX76917.1 PhzF family phenazine biosynthesis protein [Spiribacter halobius]
MATLDYELLDVFTDIPLAGNPLAVFPEAAGLSDARMQRIAAELNLSETVFVTDGQPATGRYTVRIMTPATELPFAGHPTIGTAVALARRAGAREATTLTLVEGVGPVQVQVEPGAADTGRAVLTAPAPPAPVPTDVDGDTAAAVLGVEPQALAGAPRAWSAGVPFLCVPLASRATLDAIRLDTGRWQAALADGPAPHVYAYWLAGEDLPRVHARMFAPAMGIAEDPATGAAAVAFAGELVTRLGAEESALHATIHQGEALGRPSRLELEVDVSGAASGRCGSAVRRWRSAAAACGCRRRWATAEGNYPA